MKDNSEIYIDIYSKEQIIVTNYLKIDIGTDIIEINMQKVKKMKNVRIAKNTHFKKETLLKTVVLDKETLYLYTSKSKSLYITNNINYFYKIKQNLKTFVTKKYVYFLGTITNSKNKQKQMGSVYLNDKKVAKIKRISSKKYLRDFVCFRIKTNKIINSPEIHNRIRIGSKYKTSIPVIIKDKKIFKGIKCFNYKKIDNTLIIVRNLCATNKFAITKIPFEKEYQTINIFKNKLAYLISKIIPKQNINLMFEKESLKANESGYYVFTKIMEMKNKEKTNKKTYFIIDENSSDYEKLITKYKNNVIKKYTFKHYLYIYLSKYFISSELSNHVINPRLFIKNLNEEINKKPLIFLQHGIMFAKPIDNPAARGFYKKYSSCNIYKSVISSDLEAEQFYKAGYEKEDLIKCGLTKFDISFLNPNADKITYMITYRYWEEANVLNSGEIENTTYFNAYKRVIEAFEKEGIIDKLVISCHPKFMNKLVEVFSKYENIIEYDINKAIENSKIFITDYSSTSYDAHFRGSYIIYDWSEKDYLIEKYKAIPPINETNCDGVPTYNVDELIKEVKIAIKKNYKVDKKYEDNYKVINEFSDRKNAERLIEELRKLEII